MVKMAENTTGVDFGRVRGLLFDVDGTLSDTDDHMVDQLSEWLSPVAVLFRNRNPRRFARWAVMASETPANFIYGLPDKLGFDEPLARLYNRLSRRRRAKQSPEDRFQIISGIQTMLEELQPIYPMAVVSARDAETTGFFLDQFDLRRFFNVIVTAHTCAHTKPFPDPVTFAAAEMGLPVEDCLMVGDTIVDIRAGQAAGAQTVAVLCGFGTERELRRAGADLILPSTPDLTDLLVGDVQRK